MSSLQIDVEVVIDICRSLTTDSEQKTEAELIRDQALIAVVEKVTGLSRDHAALLVLGNY